MVIPRAGGDDDESSVRRNGGKGDARHMHTLLSARPHHLTFNLIESRQLRARRGQMRYASAADDSSR